MQSVMYMQCLSVSATVAHIFRNVVSFFSNMHYNVKQSLCILVILLINRFWRDK